MEDTHRLYPWKRSVSLLKIISYGQNGLSSVIWLKVFFGTNFESYLTKFS